MKTIAKPTDSLSRVIYAPVQSGLALFIVFAACVAGIAVLKFAPQAREVDALAAAASPNAKQKRSLPRPASSIVSAEPVATTLVPLGEYYVGVYVDLLDPAFAAQMKLEKGIVVRYIVPDSPAEAAGLQPNDILLTACDEPLTQPCGLGFAMNKTQGGEISLDVLREGKTMNVALKPAKRPAVMWTPPGLDPAEMGNPNMAAANMAAANMTAANMPPVAADQGDRQQDDRKNLQAAIEKLEAELAAAREEVKSLKAKLAEQEKEK